MKHRDTSLLENKCRRDRKLFSEQDEQMMRMINKDPKTATIAMNKKLTAIGVHSLRSTITRTDNRSSLKARRHRKTSFFFFKALLSCSFKDCKILSKEV